MSKKPFVDPDDWIASSGYAPPGFVPDRPRRHLGRIVSLVVLGLFVAFTAGIIISIQFGMRPTRTIIKTRVEVRVPARLLDHHEPSMGWATERSHRDPNLARLARQFIQNQFGQRHPRLQVYCWTQGDWVRFIGEDIVFEGEATFNIAGQARRSQERIDLGPNICQGLVRTLYLHPGKLLSDHFYDDMNALEGFAHEAVHISGVSNEAKTECYASQLADDMGALFGLGPELQSSINRYAGETYPFTARTMGDEYYTESCHDGSPLDLHPESRQWP